MNDWRTSMERIEGIIIYRKSAIVPSRQTRCRIKSFCRGERPEGEQHARPRLCSSHDESRPLLFLYDFDPPSRRSRQMKALFRRIDKINRVAHDNADNFATIRTRPASGTRTNKYALAGNAREKRTGDWQGWNARRVSFPNSITGWTFRVNQREIIRSFR